MPLAETSARHRALRADDLENELSTKRAEKRIAAAMATPAGRERAERILRALRIRLFGRR